MFSQIFSNLIYPSAGGLIKTYHALGEKSLGAYFDPTPHQMMYYDFTCRSEHVKLLRKIKNLNDFIISKYKTQRYFSFAFLTPDLNSTKPHFLKKLFNVPKLLQTTTK